MSNFPFFKHWVVKLVFGSENIVDELLIDALAKRIIKELKLNVVKETEYRFTKGGLTKIFVLSQSHMIFHTWPEKKAVHIDLMTCSKETKVEKFRVVWSYFLIKSVCVKKLDY